MNKKRLFVIIGLVLVLLVVAIVLLKLVPASCARNEESAAAIGSEEADKLYAVVGEKPASRITNGGDEAGAVQEIVYEDGVVSIDEINEYIRKLMKEDGFVVTKEATIGEDGRQTYQLGKQAEQENKVILVDFRFENGGSVHVVYRLADGPLETVG